MTERAIDGIFNEDCITRVGHLADGNVDLVIVDPPYGLGKDYGSDSDKLPDDAYLAWSERRIDVVRPKLAHNGSLYLFCTWQYTPELFVALKQRLTMANEIIWDRRVSSIGGSTRKFSSVHDNIGFLAASRGYYFDVDAVRTPYDAETKKARSRKRFEGKKWLEVGYNPKDVWSVSRLHRQDSERAEHPTQKPLELVERMILASCPPGGLVLDPFLGSGTTAVACTRLGRHFVGFEINADYCRVTRERVAAVHAAADVNVQSTESQAPETIKTV